MNFRVNEAEKKAWEAEADRRDITLSQLIRHVMNDLCKRRRKSKKRT